MHLCQSRLYLLRKWLIAASAVAIGFISAPASAQSSAPETFGRQRWWLHTAVSQDALAIDRLFNAILWMTSITLVGVFVAMIVFLVKYRHRPGRRAIFIHGNNRLETVWTLVPALLMILTAALSQATWSSLKNPSARPSGEDVIRVDVVGKQFDWFFVYPGADGKFGRRDFRKADATSTSPADMIGLDRSDPNGADDIVITGTMVVPVNRQVVCDISSVDVIHSFFLPNFRVKQDAMPGLRTEVWFTADKTSAEIIGSDPANPLQSTDNETFAYVHITDAKPFDIMCAELCGQGHYTMNGQLYVVTAEEYEKFLVIEQKNAAAGAEEDDYGY